MTKERLVTFTDAILAIIMTILVLDLDKPETPNFAGLWELRENYFAYALSFFWLGTMWINLTKEWKDVEKVNNPVLWWNIVMLFFASLIPYVTNYAGINFYDAFAQSFYAVIIILVSTCNLILSVYVARANKEDVDLYERIKTLNRWMFVDIVFKICGWLLGLWIYPPIAMFTIVVAAFIPTLRLIHFHREFS